MRGIFLPQIRRFSQKEICANLRICGDLFSLLLSIIPYQISYNWKQDNIGNT